jgi:4-amino-4-deoxy-L-arabinose transferase-like glycosyltransferase
VTAPPEANPPPPRWLAVGLLALAGALHVVSALRRPLPRYGGSDGAEYIEHLRRIEVFDALRAEAGGWRSAMELLDGVEFPPLMVLLQAPLDQLFGPSPSVAVLSNLAWIALLAAGAWGIGRVLADRGTALWGALILVLLPAVWGIARTWYYDLPMAAWTSVALAAWLAAIHQPRGRRALGFVLLGALAAAAAVLTKWEGVLYLGTGLGAVLLVAALRGSAGRRGALLVLGSAALAAAPIWLHVRLWPRAFGFRFGQFWTVNGLESADRPLLGLGGVAWQRLLTLPGHDPTFYPEWLVATSLGPLAALAALVALLLLRRWPWPLAVFALAWLGATWAVLALGFDIREVRFLHPVLPGLALGMAAALAGLPRRAPRAGLLALVALLAIQLIGSELEPRDGGWPLLPEDTEPQNGWRRTRAVQQHDGAAIREALARLDALDRPWTLHPLNGDLGAARYAWRYWALHTDVRADGWPALAETCRAGGEVAGEQGWLDALQVLDFAPGEARSAAGFDARTGGPYAMSVEQARACGFFEGLGVGGLGVVAGRIPYVGGDGEQRALVIWAPAPERSGAAPGAEPTRSR